ncbi:murein L,D-transpeptidase family protein [Hydrogenophaga sp.]|uniref:L,D-transpeptidase family protein n=1 Tax=Hydrogenophaga sp. TaxID=1904254 RepID=UPI00271F5550|nr:L,D-transpeptidase [Hydrogenophaga sp.]MDO8906849.1 L,D-transpeptidase [Hydrogenophaga sp.]
MASSRSSQAGHASLQLPVSPVTMATGPKGRGALAMVFGAVFLLGLTFVLGRGAGWPEGASLLTRTDSEDGGATARSSLDALPSFIESAQAKTAVTALSAASPRGNGLARVGLADEGFQQVLPLLGEAEARLIDIYQHIGQGKHREALRMTESLVAAHPNFQLAQLILGDLLTLQTHPVRQLGNVPDTTALAAREQLSALREESSRRLRALTERPPEGSVPSQILTLAPRSRHVIAVDASRSRLYLFENLTPVAAASEEPPAPQLRLIGDFYISVGLSGIEKVVEGDQRTPLGVYYITSNLNPANLPDLYGAGALPINYPNALDLRRGKTGHGIWLHGTPRAQFVRAPQASDGCVVLSNPDLKRLLETVAIRTTPVIIAQELQWVKPDAPDPDREAFHATLEAWRDAKSLGTMDGLKAYYSDQFRGAGRNPDQWWSRVDIELRNKGDRAVQLKELSVLRWRDSDDTMVVTFGEVVEGQSRGVTKRQYWGLENGHWKIFFEGQVG